MPGVSSHLMCALLVTVVCLVAYNQVHAKDDEELKCWVGELSKKHKPDKKSCVKNNEEAIPRCYKKWVKDKKFEYGCVTSTEFSTICGFKSKECKEKEPKKDKKVCCCKGSKCNKPGSKKEKKLMEKGKKEVKKELKCWDGKLSKKDKPEEIKCPDTKVAACYKKRKDDKEFKYGCLEGADVANKCDGGKLKEDCKEEKPKEDGKDCCCKKGKCNEPGSKKEKELMKKEKKEAKKELKCWKGKLSKKDKPKEIKCPDTKVAACFKKRKDDKKFEYGCLEGADVANKCDGGKLKDACKEEKPKKDGKRCCCKKDKCNKPGSDKEKKLLNSAPRAAVAGWVLLAVCSMLIGQSQMH